MVANRFEMGNRAIWDEMARVVAELSPEWYLGGGTGISEYLHHRDSEDLDFIIHAQFDFEAVADKLDGSGLAVTRAEPGYVQGWLDNTKVEMVGTPGIHQLEAPTLIRGMPVGSLRDLLPTKINAIRNRGRLRDYVDLMVADSTGAMPIDEVIQTALLKYDVRTPSALVFEVKRALAYFDDIPEDEIAGFTKAEVSEYWRSRLPGILLGSSTSERT